MPETRPTPLAFDRALTFVLRIEGGYSDRAADRGGPTCFGVTQKAFDAYRLRRGLPLESVQFMEQPECRDFYFTGYWLAAGCAQLPDRIALAHFDAAVNVGPRQAGQLLQRALRVNADGVVGPGTVAAAQAQDGWPLLRRLLVGRARFYATLWRKDPTQRTFRRGWVNRLRKLRRELREWPA